MLLTDDYDNVYLSGRFEDTATFGDTTITSLGFQDIFLVKYSSTGEQLWLKTAGGDWGASASSVTINNSGQLYLAGIFGGTTFFGSDSIISNGMRDVFLARYDLSGTLQWIDSWGSDEHDYSSDLLTDNEFVYLSCSFSGETTINDTILTDRSAQIIQLSNSGEVLDFIQLGDYYRNKCTIDNNSALFVTGAISHWPKLYGDSIMSSPSFGRDIFLTRIDYKHTGINDTFTQTSPLLIYPNPATDFIALEIEDEAVVLITNMNGQLFGQYEFNKGFKNRKINVADFPPGLYIIIVQTASKTQTAKFIRQ